MQDLERLTLLVEASINPSVTLTRSRQQVNGDYVVFCFYSATHKKHRFVKLVPQNNGGVIGLISPVYVNDPNESDSEWYEKELVSVEVWLDHIIPTLFPVEIESPTQTATVVNYKKWIIVPATNLKTKQSTYVVNRLLKPDTQGQDNCWFSMSASSIGTLKWKIDCFYDTLDGFEDYH